MDQISDRRSELLDRIVDTLLVTGVAELSLRPLAEQVGTSARLLIYHFDTKEALVACALEKVRARVSQTFRQRFATGRPGSLEALLLMFWEWALEEPHISHFRLLFEVDGLAMFARLPTSKEAGRANASVWLSMIDKAVAPLNGRGADKSGLSTLILAALAGLMQDYLSTGERARTTLALSHLIALIPGADASISLNQDTSS